MFEWSIPSISGASPDNSGGNAGVTVCSTGVNLGQIIQPFTGSPYNGGLGLTLPNSLGASSTGQVEFNSQGLAISSTGSDMMKYGAIAVGAVLLILLIRKRRA
jgi:hypothetical protein